MLSVWALLTAGYLLFRPLAAPIHLPDSRVRVQAHQLVQTHGEDTLSFFKLREDHHYFFTHDRRAFVSYRVEGRVLLIAGDPIGPRSTFSELLDQLFVFAEVRALKLGFVGASKPFTDLAQRSHKFRSLYIGDEALIDIPNFSLQGRAIRKVRQSVTRIEKAGYKAELIPISDARCCPERPRGHLRALARRST